MSIFDEVNEIMSLNQRLGDMLGVRKIEVRKVDSESPIKVTRYVKALGPWNDEIFLTEEQSRRAKLLGLSIREAEACNE